MKDSDLDELEERYEKKCAMLKDTEEKLDDAERLVQYEICILLSIRMSLIGNWNVSKNRGQKLDN